MEFPLIPSPTLVGSTVLPVQLSKALSPKVASGFLPLLPFPFSLFSRKVDGRLNWGARVFYYFRPFLSPLVGFQPDCCFLNVSFYSRFSRSLTLRALGICAEAKWKPLGFFFLERERHPLQKKNMLVCVCVNPTIPIRTKISATQKNFQAVLFSSSFFKKILSLILTTMSEKV